MNITYPIALLALITISHSVNAAIYQCKDAHGQTVFSQLPCAPDAKKITVKTVEPTEDQAKETAAANKQNKSLASDGEYRRRLSNARERLQAIISERDAKLAVLKAKKMYATNSLAGATWEKSISEEMKAVTERYNHDIDAARQRIKDIESERMDKK